MSPLTPQQRSLLPLSLLLGAALLAVTAAVYAPVGEYGFIWDDETYVEFNPTLLSPRGLWDIWTDTSATPQYYPLVHTSYWLEYRLWELEPRGYHWMNVLLHAGAALLLWRVLVALAVPGAWLAAAVFAIHPVGVESVAWVTERKNVLSALFYFASALVFLRLALPGTASGRNPAQDSEGHASPAVTEPPRLQRNEAGLYLLSLSLFIAALFSKTTACSLPAALLLVIWWKRGRVTLRDGLALAPFFAVGLALGLLTVFLEKEQVGATGADWNFSPIDRILIAGRALVFYASKLLWPVDLNFVYPRWQISSGELWQYLYPLSVAAVLASLWLGRKRLGRGPLVALLIFAGTLVPALGFFDVYPMRFSFVADHFQYLATPSFIALVVACASQALLRLAPNPGTRRRAFEVGGAVLVLGLLALLNRGHQPQFKDLDSLWRTTLAKNPHAWIASYNLAMDLDDAGAHAEAEALFREAMESRPGYEKASSALALSLSQRGLDREAAAQFRTSLEMNPESVAALNNLAKLLATTRDPSLFDLDEAQRLSERAVAASEEALPQVLATRALIHSEQDELSEAIEVGSRAAELARSTHRPALSQEISNQVEFYRLRLESEGGD